LAEASNRRFTMFWPLTPACAAPFADLFANPWPVETVDAAAVAGWPYISGWFAEVPDLLVAREPRLVIGHPTWLIRPGQFAHHDRLAARCRDLFAELQPIPSIQQTAERFRQERFRPIMIGVHLRRGDLLRQRPDVAANSDQALAAVDRYLAEFPDAGILLCTDDGSVEPDTGKTSREGVHERFHTRYGASVVWTTPRSLDRNTPAAIQDALVDLWLLRQSDCFVGSEGSSFSELALYGRVLPHVLVAGATPRYQRLERLARLTGVAAALRAHGRRQLGKDLPFPVLLRHYLALPRRWLGRMLRFAAPALYQKIRRART
jgi:hypothetical protein